MERKEILRIIKNLAGERAPSGLEEARGQVFKEEMENVLKSTNIPVERDVLGNVFVKFEAQKPKRSVAILAHLDEIGGTIRKINKDGTLEFSKRGGYETRWIISRVVKILNKDNQWINGVIEGRSTHSTPHKLRNKESIELYEQKIFIGAQNKEDVVNSYKIHIGAPFVFTGMFNLLNPEIDEDIIAGYSMDNLVAVTSLISLTQKIKDEILNSNEKLSKDYNIYIVATAREEIGTEGALYFARNRKIDHVIAIDIGLVADFSGAVSSGIKLKGGPVIIWQERTGVGILDYNACKKMVEVAEKISLKYQDGVCEFYGSDAGNAQKWLGIPSILVGIPVLYSHNVPEISTLSGIEAAATLIHNYLKNLD
jgi:putative aminopeptidase FrvX